MKTSSLINYLTTKKYVAYLLSLIILLFGQIFLPRGYEAVWQHLIVIQNVVVGLLLFWGVRKWLFTIVLILGIILLGQCLVLYWVDNNTIRFSMGVIFSVYFLIASAKVYKDVLLVEEVGHEMIAAVFSGFIMLGIIGGFLFTLIELAASNSFSNLGEGESRWQNLNYFSFISLLTIGYGDIVPMTQMAKKTAILLGLLGNFYLTFVTAVIIGKYLNQKNRVTRVIKRMNQ